MAINLATSFLRGVPSRQAATALQLPSIMKRGTRYQAFDADFDPDEVAEARAWRTSFDVSKIPKGNTKYSRSSGPGGQHVNK
jgi:peptidyl-tRNA hydrolase ICT1